MKTYLILVSLSFSMPVFANQKFETLKEQAMTNIDAQIEELKKGKDCVSQAASNPDLKKCRTQMRQGIKAIKQKKKAKDAPKKTTSTSPESEVKPKKAPANPDEEK